MKCIIVSIVILLVTPLSAKISPCPDSDDIIHGLNTQKAQFKQNKDITLAGKSWQVETARPTDKGACRLGNFFSSLDCYSRGKKLKFIEIPYGFLKSKLCKYQVYVVGEKGIYGEITLKEVNK